MTTPSNQNPPATPPANPPGNEPANPPAAPPPPSPAPPQQSGPVPPQYQQHANAQAPGTNFGEVMNTLNAMPEKIVNAIREATQPPKPPAQPAQGQGTQGQQTTAQAGAQDPAQGAANAGKSPGRKTFADWWFGS